MGDDERRALIVLRVAGTAVLLLTVVMLTVFPAAVVHENVPGFASPVIGFELASTPAHVFGILGAPGDPARTEAVRRMDRGNRIDFLFMIAYPLIYVGLALLLAAHGRLPRPAVWLLMALAAVMTLGDALENRELLRLSAATDAQAMAPALGRLRVFTLVKWSALWIASGIAAVAIWRESGWWRWTALPFGGAALLGVASVIHLPAVEYGSYAMALAWLLTYVRAFR